MPGGGEAASCPGGATCGGAACPGEEHAERAAYPGGVACSGKQYARGGAA